MSAIDQFRRSRARALRNAETSAERALWRLLKSLPLKGTHFRRQAPVGPYIADFACLSQRLLIELDGPSHAMPDGQAHDLRRTAFLEAEGYRILRFWNSELFENPDGVLETIRLALPASALQ